MYIQLQHMVYYILVTWDKKLFHNIYFQYFLVALPNANPSLINFLFCQQKIIMCLLYDKKR